MSSSCSVGCRTFAYNKVEAFKYIFEQYMYEISHFSLFIQILIESLYHLESNKRIFLSLDLSSNQVLQSIYFEFICFFFSLENIRTLTKNFHIKDLQFLLIYEKLKVLIRMDLCLKGYNIFSQNKIKPFYYLENNLIKNDFEFLIFYFLQ